MRNLPATSTFRIAAAARLEFHIDCLVAAIGFNRTLYPEVLDEIVDGLRAAVNAYAYIRQGVQLFSLTATASGEEPVPVCGWDNEDQELLDSSMHEMDKMEATILDDPPSWRERVAKASNAETMVMDKPTSTVVSQPRPRHKPSPAFGTHIREGIEIIKDWIENPKTK
jgi:hypothetical protein